MSAIHEHDTDTTTRGTTAVDTAPSPWLAVRVIFTVAAAVLLLVGSFFEWTGGTDGSALAIQNYWEQDAGTSHGTSTRSAKDRTRPGLVATTACPPRVSERVAAPPASVCAVVPPAVTVAPATAAPLPSSS